MRRCDIQVETGHPTDRMMTPVLNLLDPQIRQFTSNFRHTSTKIFSILIYTKKYFFLEILRDSLNSSPQHRVAGRQFSNGGISRERAKIPIALTALLGFFRPLQGTCRAFWRTHAPAPINLPRTIHRLDSANSMKSCAVFFFKPR